MRMNLSAGPQAGFTLLELALVLAILGMLTLLATREISQLQDQQRFEASQRGLETIRDAVLGTPDDRAPDGSGVRAGFAADMGRLPDRLDELWTNATGMLAFDLRPGVGDADVRVPGGWRGPYVRLPWKAANLRDGWGNAYTDRWESGVWKVGHLGADGLPGGTNGCDEDVELEFAGSDTNAWAWGQVAVNTNLLPFGACTVRVRIFRPDGTCDEGISGLAVGAGTNVVSWSSAAPVPVGVRPVRAYLEGAATNRSSVRYVALRPGTNGPVCLEIN